MLNWCDEHEFDLTFIEVMPLGNFKAEHRLSHYWSLMDLQNDITTRFTLKNIVESSGGPAKYYKIQETGQKIGIYNLLYHITFVERAIELE